MTAVALLRKVEAGLVSLDDTLEQACSAGVRGRPIGTIRSRSATC